MKYTYNFLRNQQFVRGFTLIELIVVFSVMAILSTVGIASFVTYTNSQKLRNATLDIKTMLQQAQSQSLSQVKPSGCGTFRGYEVRICCNPSGSNCPTCLSGGNYELDAVCSDIAAGILVRSVTFSSDISIDNSGTTQRSYLFIPITGGVVTGGVISVSGANNAKQQITVTNAGVVQ